MSRLSALCFLSALLTASGPLLAQDAAQRGHRYVQENCGLCHSVERFGSSPLPLAPPFRTLHERYSVEDLEEALAEGIVTGHDNMPQFMFEPIEIEDIIAYLRTLER